MAKSQTKQATNMANQNYQNVQDQSKQFQSQIGGMLPGEINKANDLSGQIKDTYTGMTGKSGAMDAGDYANTQNDYQKFKTTGGFGDLTGLKSDISSVTSGGGYNGEDTALHQKYTDLGGMGGIDPTQAASIRSGFNKLADTGGIDESTADAMRRRTASGVASVYSTLGAGLARKQAVQGGAGGSGETAQMARQMANEQGTALTNTDATIGQLRQQGTIAGLGGLSSFEQGAAAGQRQAIQGEQALSADVAAGRRSGVQQEQQLETSQAQGRLQAAGQSSQLLAQSGLQRMQAAGGLQQLYSSAPGYVTSLVQSILQDRAMTGTLSTEQTQIMQELSKNPGLFGNIMAGIQGAGQIAGGVGGLLGGIAKIGG